MNSNAPKKYKNYITSGWLNNEKIAWARSTLATRAGCTVFRVDQLVESGLKNQDLIDKLFERQLLVNELRRKFLFRKSLAIQEALDNPLLLSA